MGPSGAVEAVTPRTPLVPLVVFHVRLLPVSAHAVRAHAPTALWTPHPPAARHLQRQLDIDRLPATFRVELCVDLNHIESPDQSTKAPITFAICVMLVCPVNSNLTLPRPEKYSSNSASKSNVPAVSTEKATILL